MVVHQALFPLSRLPSLFLTSLRRKIVVWGDHDFSAHSENVMRIFAFCICRWGPAYSNPTLRLLPCPPSLPTYSGCSQKVAFSLLGKTTQPLSSGPQGLPCPWSTNALPQRRALLLSALCMGLSRHWATSTFHSLSWHQRRWGLLVPSGVALLQGVTVPASQAFGRPPGATPRISVHSTRGCFLIFQA